MSMFLVRTNVRSLAVLALVCITSTAASAADSGFFWPPLTPKQQPGTAMTQERTRTQPRVKSPDYIKSRAVELSSLPNFPTYTGSTSKPTMNVAYDARSTDKPSYDLTFETRETADVVANWYRSALQSYGWTIDPEQSDLIAAQKNGSHCQITIDASAVPGFVTEVEVFYR